MVVLKIVFRSILGVCLLFFVMGGVPIVAAERNTFKDCETCPVMIEVPPGSVTIGADQEEGRRWQMLDRMSANEGPRIEVVFASSFALGQMEVTYGQFAEFIEDTGYKIKPGCFHLTSSGWSVQPKLNWQDPGFEVTDDHPVACVRRAAILAYINWLSKKTGQSYRLPSEAEYEYAARAGQTSATQATFWGEEWTNACSYQNGADLSFVPNVPDIPYGQYADCDDGYVFTSPTASFAPNPFGFYDLAGNVSEWTADCYEETHQDIPRDGKPFSKRSCRAWVAKGGSWAGFPGLLRPATRLRILATTTGTGFGFRVARDIED
ncbi:MAG: SUMF1/EgtB/PvdO family nonheme iron enzyme [Rhodospirillaceae bacterium]